MNNVLQVKIPFQYESNKQSIVANNLRTKDTLSVSKIEELISDLKRVLTYFADKKSIIKGVLVDANYNDIIAKSARISYVLKPTGRDINQAIVGARFSNAVPGEERHIITYYVDESVLAKAIKEMEIVKRFIDAKLGGKATLKNFNEGWDKNKKESTSPFTKEEYEAFGLSKNAIRNIIVDCSVIDSFSVPNVQAEERKATYLITFFNTGISLDTLLDKLNIDNRFDISRYGDDTVSVRAEIYEKLHEEVPYLISMVSNDLSKIVINEDAEVYNHKANYIPGPTTEPIIGVIDTLFDEKVYFGEWVDYIEKVDDIEKGSIREEHKKHGTEVTSLIVDGPTLNPWLDDGCGRFRVRHFGVCLDRISVIRLIKKIKEIVSENPDIHVWNLSLGTEEEVSKNFISFDAAALDEIQANKNVIFVVSGTNDNREEKYESLRIGSPADSLNSVVVNSVKRDGNPASYTRKGTVLSFFNKPDVSYYGGDKDEKLVVCSPKGITGEFGTSFAAPWISRKLCYLIDVMGLSREVAKALIVDSAAGWTYKETTYKNHDEVGYGIVPKSISDILSTNSDEIKFTIHGVSQSYRTIYNFVPVPRDSESKYPYVARAVLCYFPQCTRSQGVDYTNRELSMQFGRVRSNGSIEDINDNTQDDLNTFNDERKSRRDFRKWENTKFISKRLKRNQALKSYPDREWGFSVTSKERLGTKMTEPLNFGAVVTLKEINGVNRIQEFKSACTMRGWIVNEINVESRVELYNENQEEIVLE